jgi:hypothetical protein
MNPEDPDCTCLIGKPNPDCVEHQCCWKCATQKVRSYLNPLSHLWLCAECNDKGNWCPDCRNIIDEDGKCSPGCDTDDESEIDEEEQRFIDAWKNDDFETCKEMFLNKKNACKNKLV